MKRAAWLIVATLATWAAQVRGDDLDLPSVTLNLPVGEKFIKLRLDVSVNGRSLREDWNRFLDELFVFFDRNGDASLSANEAKRIFPLPLGKSKRLVIDFAKLDTDNSGGAAGTEFRSYCLRNGFNPIVVFLEPPSNEDLRFGHWWSSNIKPAVSGVFAGDEWQRMLELLRRFDLNDDEILDIAELRLAADKTDAVPERHAISVQHGSFDREGSVLRLELGVGSGKAAAKAQRPFRLMPPRFPIDRYRMHDDSGNWAIVFRPDVAAVDFASTRDFLLAQFETALAGRSFLSKTEIDDDINLTGLGPLLTFADRNDDNRLSHAELTSYLQLIEKGVRNQLWLRILDAAHNPVYYFDANADSQLTQSELISVKDLTSTGRRCLPRQCRIDFTGPAGATWGGVPISVRELRVNRPPPGAMPAWFTALDRNNDRFLSSREFVGPPARFQELDHNGDGLVSVEEAGIAKK